jgi:hypothetical protein
LPLEPYTISIQKGSFKAERHTRRWRDGYHRYQVVSRKISTSLEVTGGAPIIETDSVSTGRTITFAETDNLPLTSRNPNKVILFQPGSKPGTIAFSKAQWRLGSA